MRITPPLTPELLPEVAHKIEGLLLSLNSPRVLELGSGWSTLWFAGLGSIRVDSLEHDHGWYHDVNDALEEYRLKASVSLEDENNFPLVVEGFPDNSFDLVLIDCVDSQRLPCLIAAQSKVKPGGYIVLDDSHWDPGPGKADLSKAFSILASWEQETLSGQHKRKTGETAFHQTTFFRRPQ